MRKLLFLGFLTSLFTPALVIGQSAFDGTWKLNLNKAELSKKPDTYVLQGGMYHCKTCVPPVDVKADGQDQKVTGHPYYDTASIRVVDDRTIEETYKRDGKSVITSKTTVSPDDKTLSFEFSDSSATNADPVTGKGEATRVAKGPAGSHAISGSWRTIKMENLSDNGLTVSFKVENDSLSMTNLTGQSYTAKLDGTEAPYKGDPGTTSVSVKRIDKSTIEETDKREGKVIAVLRLTVSSDGKSMTAEVNDKLHGTTSRFVAEKQ